jgi:tetratricopeptide (TPR) repeat protein
MAEAAVAMAHEEYDAASAHLRLVLRFEGEIEDVEMLAIANFWLGRALRKQGRYDESLEYTARGERHALSLGYTGMAAIMQVTLSWLAFQKGRLHEANRILSGAEDALNRTDDFLSRGNVQSAYGRIARRQGKYEAAVERFESAIGEFRHCGGEPLALARTLVNLAFVKRLLAVRAQKELDHLAAMRRGKASVGADPGRRERSQIEVMRQQARECLREAAGIYKGHQNHRGIAAVRVTEGFLHLDAGDLEKASLDAVDGFTHASGRSDAIIMSRARTLQCIIEQAAIDEQLGDAVQHREAAELFAREAVSLAGQTENRRLLARALVWQGLTFTIEPADLESARRCCEQAMGFLAPETPERQYRWEELEMLKTHVLHAQPVETMLRAWSAGIVEGRSLAQIIEEFTRIVIRRVWQREGRIVSRVARKLSVSPKKVRRIVQATGWSEQHKD